MENNLLDVLKFELENRKEEYLSYLKDLVAIDTQDIGHGILGGKEKLGQEYIIDLLNRMGVDILDRDFLQEEKIVACKEKYNEGNLGHNYKDRFNVYALFEGKNKEKSLMFNGHVDTMPATNLELWNTDPFNPTVINNKLYGLGAADMKAGLMAAILAVKLLKDTKTDLPINVKITSVCDEEGGGNGSMQAIMSGQNADAVVVCEPTSKELIVAHMGFVFFSVEVMGKANHSGAKAKGVSAIEKAIKLIEAINELEYRWLLKYKHPLLPPPNLNVGKIEGGSAGSTVAATCKFEVCIHFLPEVMSLEEVSKEFIDTINLTCMGDTWLKENLPNINIYQSGNSFEEDINSDLVKTFNNVNKSIKNENIKIVGSPAGCDSRLWKNIAGASVVQFGPGNLSECHAINEFVELEQFFDAILIYANLILNY